MRIELLYPAIASLYGEQGNIRLLKTCLPLAEFIETELDQTPAFVTSPVDLIYMGPMSESAQLKIIDRLRPHVSRIRELIDNGTYFLITGNALDVFGQSILDDKGVKHEALGIFDFTTKEDRMHRFNCLVLGKYKDLEMVGFKSQFAMLYPNNPLPYWMEVVRGTGFNAKVNQEGIHINHFFGTNCIGPILVMNPQFMLELLEGLGVRNPKLPFEEAMIEAYQQRVKEFKDPKIIDYP